MIFSLVLLLFNISLFVASQKEGEIPSGYKNIDDFRNEMYRISSIYQKSVTLVDITQEYGSSVGGKTYEGRSIYSLKITSEEEEDSSDHKPNVLIMSGSHSNEILPPEVSLRLSELLGKVSYGVVENDELLQILKNYVVYIVPILNIDGYRRVFDEDSSWRKNRRLLVEEVHGVDLNRNYDVCWDMKINMNNDKILCISPEDVNELTEPSSDYFRGILPFSEVETTVVRNMMEDLRFAKVLDLHSYGRFVYFKMKNCITVSDPKSLVIQSMLEEIAEGADYSVGYPRDNGFTGTLAMYSYQKHTDCSFTAETALENQPDLEEAENKEIPDIIRLITKFLSLQIPVVGRLTKDGNPQGDILFEVEGISHSFDEVRRTNQDGYFYVFIPPGEYTIIFDLSSSSDDDDDDDEDDDNNNNNNEDEDKFVYDIKYDGVEQTYVEIELLGSSYFKDQIMGANWFVKIAGIVSLLSISCGCFCVLVKICVSLCSRKNQEVNPDPDTVREMESSNFSTTESDDWSKPVRYVSDFRDVIDDLNLE